MGERRVERGRRMAFREDKAVAAFAFDHHAVNYPGLFILKEFDCRRFVPNVDAAGAVFNVFLHQRIELAVCTGQ